MICHKNEINRVAMILKDGWIIKFVDVYNYIDKQKIKTEPNFMNFLNLIEKEAETKPVVYLQLNDSIGTYDYWKNGVFGERTIKKILENEIELKKLTDLKLENLHEFVELEQNPFVGWKNKAIKINSVNTIAWNKYFGEGWKYNQDGIKKIKLNAKENFENFFKKENVFINEDVISISNFKNMLKFSRLAHISDKWKKMFFLTILEEFLITLTQLEWTLTTPCYYVKNEIKTLIDEKENYDVNLQNILKNSAKINFVDYAPIIDFFTPMQLLAILASMIEKLIKINFWVNDKKEGEYLLNAVENVKTLFCVETTLIEETSTSAKLMSEVWKLNDELRAQAACGRERIVIEMLAFWYFVDPELNFQERVDALVERSVRIDKVMKEQNRKN